MAKGASGYGNAAGRVGRMVEKLGDVRWERMLQRQKKGEDKNAGPKFFGPRASVFGENSGALGERPAAGMMDGTVGEKQAGYSIGGGNKVDNFWGTSVGTQAGVLENMTGMKRGVFRMSDRCADGNVRAGTR